MATFCWEAESLPLDFVVPVSHSVLDVATEIHFVFQTFPRLFNPGLSFAVGGRNGIAGRELLLWREVAEPE